MGWTALANSIKMLRSSYVSERASRYLISITSPRFFLRDGNSGACAELLISWGWTVPSAEQPV
jgi:hypothetical protein